MIIATLAIVVLCLSILALAYARWRRTATLTMRESIAADAARGLKDPRRLWRRR